MKKKLFKYQGLSWIKDNDGRHELVEVAAGVGNVATGVYLILDREVLAAPLFVLRSATMHHDSAGSALLAPGAWPAAAARSS